MRSLDSYAVFVVGEWSPATFHPSWFEANELVPADSWSEEDVQVISNQVCAVRLAGMSVQVQPKLLALWTEDDARPDQLRDLAASTLLLLRHSKATMVQLVRGSHVQLDPADNGDGFAASLIRLADVRKVLKSDDAGLKELDICTGSDSDRHRHLVVKTSPLVKPGAHIEYKLLERAGDDDTAGYFAPKIVEWWDEFFEEADKSIDEIVGMQDEG